MSRLNHKKRYSHFFKDPLWFCLLGISGLSYLLAEDSFGYFVSTLLLIASIFIIIQLFFEKIQPLHQQVARALRGFPKDYTVLSSVELKNGRWRGYADYIVISPKGVFNVKVLDFEGTMAGNENEDAWSYYSLMGPHDLNNNSINNPTKFLLKTHRVIKSLLEDNNIKYIPIQSIIVLRNEDAIIDTDSSIPIVKAKDLFKYITQYRDRQSMTYVLDEITTIIGDHKGLSF